MGNDIVNHSISSKFRLIVIFLSLKKFLYATTSKIGGGGKADIWIYGEIDDYKLLKRYNVQSWSFSQNRLQWNMSASSG